MTTRVALGIKSINKQLKMKEITTLLRTAGPLPATQIVDLIDDLSIVSVSRYLSELALSGHIRKIPGKGGRKNIPAYQFQSDFGSKTDIVSSALSHPMHKLMLSVAKKISPSNTEVINQN